MASRPQGEIEAGRPAVGNVLGFSLLLRDRQALLRLDRRALSSGVRLVGYEAEVPDVVFPLRAHGASAFRDRRCRTRSMGLQVQAHALDQWLRRHLVGLTIGGLRIERVQLDDAGGGDDETPTPRLRIDARYEGSRQWLWVTPRLFPHGRALAVEVSQCWRFGEGDVDARKWWSAVAVRLGGRATDEPGRFVFEVARPTLLRAFVEAGWRPPDVSELSLHKIAWGQGHASLQWDHTPPATEPDPLPTLVPDDRRRVDRRLAAIRHALAHGDRAAATTELERLGDDLPRTHPARVAALRWLAALARHGDPAQEQRALRGWLHLAPEDPQASQRLLLALGRSGEDEAMARRLTAQCRLPHPPRRQARIELALATVLVDRLDEAAAARHLLAPLLSRCRAEPPLADLEPEVRSVHARALASTPARALAELDAALAGVDRSATRASMMAATAAALDRHDHQPHARPLWSEVVSIAPDDDALVDQALLSARACDDPMFAVELLRTVIEAAPPKRADGLRRTLVAALLEVGDESSHALAVEELRDLAARHPDSPTLARQLASLQPQAPPIGQRVEHLADVASRAHDTDERARLGLEQARLLRDKAEPRRAWAVLEPLLAEAVGPVRPELLELAIELAPLSVRDGLLDELVVLDEGPRSGRALLMRARSRTSASKREADLRLAAQRLPDPREPLALLAEAADDDEIELWARWAEACAAAHDPATESRLRIELGLRHMAADDAELAGEALARARALAPDSASLAVALAWVELQRGRRTEAARLLSTIPLDSTRLDAPPLDDPRLCLPDDRERLRVLGGRALLEAGRPGLAAAALRVVVAQRGVAAEPEAAAALVDALEAAGEGVEAATFAHAIAQEHEGAARATWLARAAEHASPSDATRWLAEAVILDSGRPGLALALERAARASGDPQRLELALERLAAHAALAPDDRTRAIRALLARRRGRADDGDPAVLGLYERLLVEAPDDAQALLALAAQDEREGDLERAAQRRARALAQLSATDARAIEPALAVARYELDHGQSDAALTRLLAVVQHPAAPLLAHELLVEASANHDDPTMRLRALRGLFAHSPEGPGRRHTALALARALGEAGRPHEALPHLKIAIGGLLRGTAEHIDAARLWLTLAQQANDAKQEAAARSALRRSLGPQTSAKEIRAEALLRAERLGDRHGARGLVEDALTQRPTDALLLSTLKPLALAEGSMRPYLDALRAAIEATVAGPARDHLAAELATAAAEDGDPTYTQQALDYLTASAAAADELLDLRQWAIRSLGGEAAELQQIDERLSAGVVDDAVIGRLVRMLDDPQSAIGHLLELSAGAPDSVAAMLAVPAVTLALPLGDASLLMQVLRRAIASGAREATERGFTPLVEWVSTAGDDAAVADLIALGDDARTAGMVVDDRLERLLDASIAHLPDSRHLHRALARHLARPELSPERLQAELMMHLDAVADRYELSGRDRAELFIGTAEPLDRRTAADLLSARAEQYLDEPEAFGRLLQALEQRQCWPDVVRLLRIRARRKLDPKAKVAALKHLAHVESDVLGDPGAAVVHLEDALELAPTDPDLLLPLLEHHFSQTDLSRAVTLTERVLCHVKMGDAAFAALAHRAADAAIAQDDPARARSLLGQIQDRIPADEKARARLAELDERARQPEPRVALLAEVAIRQSGAARIEALEERARLLLDPLDRPHEAMEDLAAVVAEAPQREASATLLASLYEQHGRFDEWVALLEADLPRHHGVARAERLQTIAQLHAERRGDPASAEGSLREALDELGPAEQDDPLAHELREALVDSLDAQGRHADLVSYLQRELTPILTRAEAAPTPGPPRLALVCRLAATLRDRLDDDAAAAALYERLDRWHALPDDGLVTLARWYRRGRRHEDLVRVLQRRALALPEHSERRAAVDLRIAELLDGPLVRPHDAAPHYLDAYLADPDANTTAGARARVLLCGVDSVVNVRQRLLHRLQDLDPSRRPALLTLLADILAPQADHEDEAEARYREALELDPTLAPAYEGLGRLLTRLQRHDEAAKALVTAACSDATTPARAAEAAAVAARNFTAIGRYDDAESVLKQALVREPQSQRALLELAHLYEEAQRRGPLGEVLDRLAALPLSSTMAAEIAFRRASLLRSVYERVPTGPQGERARSHLLEAVGANPRHATARRALLSLATARREWSIVAHMHYLALRELPPGTQRAMVHLDLAGTYLDRLGDPHAAMRNVESALQQAATDMVVANRTADLARRMPVRREAAERFESIAAADNELDDAARARLWLLAADLRMEDDDREAAAAASKRVLDLAVVPSDATEAANRTLERLSPQSPDALEASGSGLLDQLAQQPAAPERARLLGRLHDIGMALDDPSLVERASAEQRAMAADLDDSDEQSVATSTLLRDLLTQRGDYGPVVELYERLAQQTGDEDPARAADVLIEAAGYAWRGQQQPVQAAKLIARTLRLPTDHDSALRLLDELVRETNDPAAATELCAALTESLPQPPPAVRLQLAALAATRNAQPEALAYLRPLTGASVSEDLRLQALRQLDALLVARGDPHERLSVLQDLFSLAVRHRDPASGDLGLELAQLHRLDGDRAAARRACDAALGLTPEHAGLNLLRAELAREEEDWPAVYEAQRALARQAADDAEQASWLAQAATTLLRHPAVLPADDPRSADPTEQARALLQRACELDDKGTEAPIALLPIAFRQARWDDVLELAQTLAPRVGNDEEVLVLAALAQAYHRGERTLARDIGYRHAPSVCRQLLLPGLQQILTEIASRGPLPRLDSVLAAASALLGGRSAICDIMLSWAAERPLQAGISLGLARLLEARGFAELSRNHFALAAYLAPRGPVPALVDRLPRPPRRSVELHIAGGGPAGSRSILRETLAALREHLAGLGTAGSPLPQDPTALAPAWWHDRLERAETVLEPWRSLLRLDLPISWTDADVPGGVALRNDRPPRLVLGPQCAELSEPAFAFRLAHAAAGIALGMAVLDSGTVPLAALLDALGQLANPAHRPTGSQALALADVLAAREAHALPLDPKKRARLLNELAHWLTTDDGPQRLRLVMHRSRLLLACRLCDRLDGALLAVAQDHAGPGRSPADADATLASPDGEWLLRTLALR